ncbi:MAG: putative DNA binding domain-containing protein [Mediterranea sp.]|jgi:ATP-dependent DNA helicase RecG|nr:putative DNA binding domain-containing protein [Mediterranea sp.]
MITKDELQQFLADTESFHVERTISKTDTDKFCQAICAFSNDLPNSHKNGYLILGAQDNGELSGMKVDDTLLLKMTNIRTDGNILPQPVMNVTKFSFGKKGDVLVVEVQPSDIPPVRYRGRVWVRVGPRKNFASPAEEKILTERRLSNIHTLDAMPCTRTTLEDLDIALIKKEYLPQAIDEDILKEDTRPIEEQLASLGFYDLNYHCPTFGAIILFGKNPERYLPGAYVQYVRFRGLDRAGDIINEFKFAGCLCKTLVKMDNFIETAIAVKRPIPVSVLREETVSKYPYWATRELLMNSLMHRDYESNAPVQFYEYDDRIEILNAGNLYGKVSPDNFPNVSDYRNPFIADAMKVLGYVNRFSRGISRVQRELKENGNGEAEFDFSLITAFKVIEHISTKYFETGFGSEEVETTPIGDATTPITTPIGDATTPIGDATTPITTPIDGDTAQRMGSTTQSTTQNKILEYIRNNPFITRVELAEALNITIDGVKYQLQNMRKDGLIAHEGKSRGGKWIILKESL